MTSSTPDMDSMAAPRVAGAVCLIEAAALSAAAAMYAVELASGASDNASSASMSLIVALIFAVLLVVIGMSWLRGRQWPRTPTLVWNVLLLPAAWTLITTTGLWFGIAVGVLALVGIAAALLAPAHDVGDRAL